MKLDRIYFIVIAVFIVFTVGLAIAVPFRQQMLTVSDFQTVALLNDVSNNISTSNKAPDNINSIVKDKSAAKKINYTKVSNDTYKLCGDFLTDTFANGVPKDVQINAGAPSSLVYPSDASKDLPVNYALHKKGNYCFGEQKIYNSSTYDKYRYDYSTNLQGSNSTKPPATSSGIAANNKDTERLKDVMDLASKAEEFYATNGEYPANCTELAAIKGLPASALKSPNGTANSCKTSVPSASSDVYQYTTSSSNQKFVIYYWSDTSRAVLEYGSSN